MLRNLLGTKYLDRLSFACLALNRRSFLKCASATAALAYGFSRLPIAFGQEGSNEIDCGTVVTVPTFTGAVDRSWYGDTNDYKVSAMTQIIGQSNQYPMEGHLRTKFDEYTWFGADIPTNTYSTEFPGFWLIFDTKNTGNDSGGALDVYNLALDSFPDGKMIEIDKVTYSNGSMYLAGNPFFKAFSRGKDYDWKYVFAPSKLNSKPHPQFNVKIRTDILTKYSDKINVSASYIDALGSIDWVTGEWGKLRFVQQTIPEFEWKELVAVTAIGAGLVAAKVVKNKKEWSRREFLRFPKAVTESL